MVLTNKESIFTMKALIRYLPLFSAMALVNTAVIPDVAVDTKDIQHPPVVPAVEAAQGMEVDDVERGMESEREVGVEGTIEEEIEGIVGGGVEGGMAEGWIEGEMEEEVEGGIEVWLGKEGSEGEIQGGIEGGTEEGMMVGEDGGMDEWAVNNRGEEERNLPDEIPGGGGIGEAEVKKKALCPSGWIRFGERCFNFIRTLRTWAESERYCVLQGANLASVHSLSEYHFIQELIRAQVDDFPSTWIGGSDAAQEGLWLWSNGQRLDYTNWARGQPDNHEGQQNCMLMNWGAGLQWDDGNCRFKMASVCARRI